MSGPSQSQDRAASCAGRPGVLPCTAPTSELHSHTWSRNRTSRARTAPVATSTRHPHTPTFNTIGSKQPLISPSAVAPVVSVVPVPDHAPTYPLVLPGHQLDEQHLAGDARPVQTELRRQHACVVVHVPARRASTHHTWRRARETLRRTPHAEQAVAPYTPALALANIPLVRCV